MYYSKGKKLIHLFGRQQILTQLLIIALFILLCFYIITINMIKPDIDGRICYADRYLGKELEQHKLEDILLSDRKPRKGKSVFFHETSCTTNGILKLNARQACAIESAALLNPNLDIFVLFASPTAQLNDSSKSENDLNLLEIFKSYTNIYLRNVNIWSYAAGTPVYDFLKDGQLFESKFVLSHTSDFLRYLTLWRWGGTYLDLDIILKKSLENIKPNYAGAESDNFIAAGIINLDNDNFGHQIADMCLTNFKRNFDGNDWGHNGPGVITRVLHELCKTKSPKLMTRDRCFGFKVFNKKYFYAIEWWNWKYFFEENHLQKSLYLTNQSIAIHVWNKHSKNQIIKVGSKVAYGIYAETYCPNVYKSCGKYF